MTGNELLQTLERLLEEDGLSQEVVNRLVLALALENRHLLEAQQRQTAVELAELRHLLNQQAQNVDRLATAVADTKTYLDLHPPLLYLLRYRTKATLAGAGVWVGPAVAVAAGRPARAAAALVGAAAVLRCTRNPVFGKNRVSIHDD